MRVKHIQCGPYANESEIKAIQNIKSHLDGLPGDGLWILLSNLPFSVTDSGTSSEIDIVAIGPTGVHVLEIKHWDFRYIDAVRNAPIVEQEAEKLQRKARLIGTTLRKHFNTQFIAGKFVLTRSDEPKYVIKSKQVRGSRFYQLREWRDYLQLSDGSPLSNQMIEQIAMLLHPRAKVALTGDIRSFGSYTNLERVVGGDAFRRVYKGIHVKNRDKVILHIYDYSALDNANPDTIARREFETIRNLQKSPWLPRLVESFQDAAEYPGELFFFSVIDPSAATLASRCGDSSWSQEDRLSAALDIINALQELHSPIDEDIPAIVHRNLTPETIFIRSNGKPLFSGLRFTKLEGLSTVAGAPDAPTGDSKWIAPEVGKLGLQGAGRPADVYALCATLTELFSDESKISAGTRKLLALGLKDNPEERITLPELADQLKPLSSTPKLQAPPSPRLPDARYWDEDLEIVFRGSLYKIITKLGAGGWGTTFKVVQIDETTREELGVFVAKTIQTAELGRLAINAYRKARAHTSHSHLAAIYEIAEQWESNQIVSLMNWIDGMPLSDLTGVVPLYAEELGEEEVEDLLLRWIRQICEGLQKLHQAGFVHGDVTPKNIIASTREVVLTDYDLFTQSGCKAMSKGTLAYCSQAMEEQNPVCASDDIFSLAAALFHVVFDKLPFRFDDSTKKNSGCNWVGVEVDRLATFVNFIKRATAANPRERFNSAAEVLLFLEQTSEKSGSVAPTQAEGSRPSEEKLSPNEVPWLLELLKSYPGSPYGNTETRGLDSEFAAQTYVETELELDLAESILKRQVQLVVLTGNAGDGKTAFLQHLATKLGVKADKSSQRVIDQSLSDGLKIKINLDGSASYQGKSAIELLDALFEPYQELKQPKYLVHLVAINSGPLLSWIEDYEARKGATPLTEVLWSRLQGEEAESDWLWFVDFNHRSLVGGLDRNHGDISSNFLDRLIDSMLGGERRKEIWAPCKSCISKPKCSVADTVARVSGIEPYSESAGYTLRRKLFQALRAVHQRGEIHITARELRATLTYILFGTTWCKDIHDADPSTLSAYSDLAFDCSSSSRQGALLTELSKLDPALDAHPLVDRHLRRGPDGPGSEKAPSYGHLPLASARRRAYFEWTDEQAVRVGGSPNAISLYRGKHLDKFLMYPLMSGLEQEDLLRSVCAGLSRLVDLPALVLRQRNQVPIRITPRTPTETTLWVNKDYKNFSLEACLPEALPGLETLHTHLLLSYNYNESGREPLLISASLFGVLMELSEGFQIAGSALDDTFANLSIFTERLAQEDQECIFAWNPASEHIIFRVLQQYRGGKRVLAIEPLDVDTPGRSDNTLVEVTS